MENKSSLCRSWWSAGAVLFVFCLLAYFKSTQPDGGVSGAVGALFFTLVRLVVFAFGLAIGIAICIAVMLGLFVACAYFLGGEELGRETSEKVKKAVVGKLRQCAQCVNHSLEPEAATCVEVQSQPTPAREYVESQAISSEISANADQTAAVMREVEKVSEAVRAVAEHSREALTLAITQLQERLEQLAGRCETQDAAAKTLDGLAARMDALERNIAAFAALPQQLGDLQNEVRPLQEGLKQVQEDLKAKPAAAKPTIAEQQPKPKTPRPKKG